MQLRRQLGINKEGLQLRLGRVISGASAQRQNLKRPLPAQVHNPLGRIRPFGTALGRGGRERQHNLELRVPPCTPRRAAAGPHEEAARLQLARRRRNTRWPPLPLVQPRLSGGSCMARRSKSSRR